MPVLEQVANFLKNKALFAGEADLTDQERIPLRDPAAFARYCATKQISVMRAAAGVTSFMNDFAVKTLFLDHNKQMHKKRMDDLVCFIRCLER